MIHLAVWQPWDGMWVTLWKVGRSDWMATAKPASRPASGAAGNLRGDDTLHIREAKLPVGEVRTPFALGAGMLGSADWGTWATKALALQG